MKSTNAITVLLGTMAILGIEIAAHKHLLVGESTPQPTAAPSEQNFERPSFEASGQTDRVEQRVTELNREIDRLNNKIEGFAQTLQLMQTQLSIGTGTTEATEDAFADEENIIEHALDREQREASLEQQLIDEQIDPDWSGRMERRVENSVQRFQQFGLAQTQLTYTDCRSTLCMAEFTHGGNEDPKFLSLALSGAGIDRLTVVPGVAGDGTAFSKVYFYREGYDDEDRSR